MLKMDKPFHDPDIDPIKDGAAFYFIASNNCNANCVFCYDQVTYAGEGRYLEHDDPVVEAALQLCIKAGIEKVVFTGGEPTIQPEKLVKLIRRAAPQFGVKRKLYSNGYGLFADVEGSPLIEQVARTHIDILNLSRAHHDEAKNTEIMRAKKVSTVDEIRRIADLQEETRVLLKLSSYMTPDGVFSAGDMHRYVEFGESCGVNNFLFRAGGHVPDKFRKTTPESSLHHRINEEIDLDSIVEQLVADYGYTELSSRHDGKYHLHVLTNGKSKITIKKEFKIDEGDSKKINRIILGPERIARSSWIDDSRTIALPL